MKRTYVSIVGAVIMGAFLPLFFISAEEKNHVMINEIKVGGEKATDEFVELYNPTDANVNLAGWRLSKKTASGSLANLVTEFPSLIISAHGLLLVTHNDYTGVSTKDLAYSTQSSITADNTIILYSDNGQTIVDLVGMGSTNEVEGNAAPSPDAGMSIERNDGADSNNNGADFIVRATPSPKHPANTTLDSGNTDQGTGNTNQEQPNTGQGSSATAVTFNEMLPNPMGSDEEGEWIELANLGDREVNLTDWAVEDASGKHFTIKISTVISSTTIAPKGYFLLPRAATGISLNNTGTEILKLLNPNEQTIVSISYAGPVEEAQSWARNIDGNFAWTTTPTPSASNVITVPQVQENNKSSSNSSSRTSAVDSAPATVTPTHFSLPSLVINELLPNPIDEDATGEWIELKNEADDEATLAGITLSDASGTTFTFTTQQKSIPPHELLLLPRAQTKIVLNNDGDTIAIRYRGQGIARADYGKSEEGMSFARDVEGNYAWTTTPSPNGENIFSLPAEIEENPDEMKDGQSTPAIADKGTQNFDAPSAQKQIASLVPSVKDVHTVAINAIRELPRNTNVSVEGIVIVTPLVFGKTSFYLDGIQVYSMAIKFPDLALGDHVQVKGYVSTIGNETRITVPKTGVVKRLGEGDVPEPHIVTAEIIGEEYEGKLIRVEGELMEKKGTTLWLDDESGEVRVTLKEGTGLTNEIFVMGERYMVTGVLSETSSGYRVLPRGDYDIVEKGAVMGVSTGQASEEGYNSRPVYYVITACSVIIIAGGLGWRKWKEHQNTKTPSSHNSMP